MLIMIVIVALVAIGGLLYIGMGKSSDVAPVFVEKPAMETPTKIPSGTVLGKAGGQIRFQVVPVTDSAGGQVKFSTK